MKSVIFLHGFILIERIRRYFLILIIIFYKGVQMFSQAVIEKLEFYVYFLQDPRDDKIFYVGKGIGNRVFDHMECAIDTNDETEKIDKIRDIVNSGNKVKHFILRHGLSEVVSFEVESAVIDFVGVKNLLNLKSGRNARDFGIKTADEISAMYEAQELNTNKPILLININKCYRRDMSDNELYDATRESWVLGAKREKVVYAVATYRGLTREVYKINEWYPVKERWGFHGTKANESIREELRYKSVSSFFPKGAINPIKYLNC
jgi:hypothetical protein